MGNSDGVKRESGWGSKYGARPEPALANTSEPATRLHAVRADALRFPSEDDFDVAGTASPGSLARATSRYAAARPEFAFSSAYLEGNSFTLPEVQTLLDGITPAGKPIEDVQQVQDLGAASQLICEWVDDGDFVLGWDRADQVNAVLAEHEAIDAGVRRTNSSVNPDGRGATVNVMGETFVGLNKIELQEDEAVALARVKRMKHPVLRAATMAAMVAYLQPYHDGNNRTGRYLMDAELMSHGYDAVAIPAARSQEYQRSLAQMFRTGDTTPYVGFLIDMWRRRDAVV